MRRTPIRSLLAVALPALVVAVTVTGCADDANDGAYQLRRAAALAAELHGATTEPPAPATTQPPAHGAPPASTVSTDAAPPVTTTPAVEPTGVVVPVIAIDNSFRPQQVEISVGDEVLWENRGLNEHDVLSVEDGDWGVQTVRFQPGDVYSHVFTAPGEYRYYCSIHGSPEVGMTGTVIVTG